MKTVNEYKIVTGTANSVCESVNKMIRTGWELRGDLVWLANYDCSQTMVKYEDTQ